MFGPVKVDNLLVAGRPISGCFEAHASYRVTGNCVSMGEAAGIAAALALKHKTLPRNLDGTLVVEKLREKGVNLDNADFRPEDPANFSS